MDTAKASMLYALNPPDEFLDYFAPPLGAGRPMPRKLLPHLACATPLGAVARPRAADPADLAGVHREHAALRHFDLVPAVRLAAPAPLHD